MGAKILDSVIEGASRGWIAYAIVVAACVTATAYGDHASSYVTLLLAMPVLAVVMIINVRPSLELVPVYAALAFSFAGDTTGDFLLKLILFGGAHAAYIIAFYQFRRYARNGPLFAVILLSTIGAANEIHQNAVMVVAYIALLCGMAWLASGLGRVGAIGGLVFMASDALIAVQGIWPQFNTPGLNALALALYLIGQGFLILAVTRRFDLTQPRRA